MGRFSDTVLLSSVLIYCFFASTSATTTAPLLIWSKEPSTSKCQEQFTSSTLQTAETVFNDGLMGCILGENIPTKAVLFLQNGLSVDTLRHVFAANTDGLQKLRKHLESPSSVVIPAFQFDEVPEQSFSAFKEGNIDFEVVYLPDELESAANMMENKLNLEEGNMLCLLTAADAAGEVSLKRNRRDVTDTKLSTDTGDYCFHGTCIAICFSDIKFKAQDNDLVTMAVNGDMTESCDNSTVTIVQDFEKPANETGSVYSLKLQMTFEMKMFPVSAMEWWVVKSANATYATGKSHNDSNSVTFIERSFRSLTAPRHWSFACDQPPMLYSRSKKDKKSASIQLQSLQVQPFDIKDGFSDAVDCSSWVTAPLILSLLITLFLIIMMAYAFNMVTSITTMDRFDDPKGKGISVPQDS